MQCTALKIFYMTSHRKLYFPASNTLAAWPKDLYSAWSIQYHFSGRISDCQPFLVFQLCISSKQGDPQKIVVLSKPGLALDDQSSGTQKAFKEVVDKTCSRPFATSQKGKLYQNTHHGKWCTNSTPKTWHVGLIKTQHCETADNNGIRGKKCSFLQMSQF